MQNLLSDLREILAKDERFVVEGKLLKNKVIEACLQVEPSLLKLLLKNDNIKAHFFQEVEGLLVFDKVKFQQFVSNKEFLPDSYTAFKNKIGLTADGEFLAGNKEVVLSWAYKDCVLEGGQDKEDAKRDEVFWNEVLAPGDIDRLLHPKVFTNWKRYTQEGEQEAKEVSLDDNLILKGNNLLALHSLKQVYRGRVKLIYIDPPYNTEGDSNTFAYNNTFNHSSWLTFMRNRLAVARELLCKDGVLVVTIDDYEQAYLKVLCDEVFKRENFIGTVVVQSNPRGRTTNTHFATSHEYAMFYAKNIESVEINYLKLTKEQELDFGQKDEVSEYRLLPFRRSGGTSTPEERPNSYYAIYYNEKDKSFSLAQKAGYVEIFPIDSLGKKRVWRQTRPSFLEAVQRGDMVCKRNGDSYTVYMKDRIKDGRKPKTIWYDSKYDASSSGTMILKKLFDGEKVFSYPKSIYAVKDTVDIITERGGDDIVLDFFGGSGTTAQAVLDLNKEDGGNRKFILCEQMNYVESVTAERVKKIVRINQEEGFVYAELKKANQTWIDEVMAAVSDKALNDLWENMQKHAFISYKIEPKAISETAKDFERLDIEDKKRFLVEVLDKNALYVNFSDIENEDFQVSEADKALTKLFYSLK